MRRNLSRKDLAKVYALQQVANNLLRKILQSKQSKEPAGLGLRLTLEP